MPDSECHRRDVSEYLRHLKGAGRTRNNHRSDLCTLFSFARSYGYIPKDHIDFAEDVALAREGHNEIEIFTPEEMTTLLSAVRATNFAGQGLLPHLLLGAFAGMRTAEIQRQRWDDINLVVAQ
jgi:integrase